MRLIDADALITVFEKQVKQSTYSYFHLDEIVDEIMDAATIDAVPVVRCKDCKHRGVDGECPMYHEEYIEWDDDGYMECEYVPHDNTHDDDFCSYGERKDNA